MSRELTVLHVIMPFSIDDLKKAYAHSIGDVTLWPQVKKHEIAEWITTLSIGEIEDRYYKAINGL